MTDWNRLAEQVGDWSFNNFGEGHPSNCILGMTEEIGEYYAVTHDNQLRYEDQTDRAEIKRRQALRLDAIADTIIFMADFCNRHRLDMNRIAQVAQALAHVEPGWHCHIALGQLAHHQLKINQGIRGDTEEHRKRFVPALAVVFHWAYHRSAVATLEDFSKLVWKVWKNVKRRNWKANPITGGEA